MSSLQDVLSFVTDQGRVMNGGISNINHSISNESNGNSRHHNHRNKNDNINGDDDDEEQNHEEEDLTNRWTWSRRESAEEARHRTDYEILKELGSGGFGKVFLVRNKIDLRLYAMKVVPLQMLEGDNDNDNDHNSNNKERVLREAKVLSSLRSNDHVVRYYSAWVEKGESAVFAASGTSTDRTPSDYVSSFSTTSSSSPQAGGGVSSIENEENGKNPGQQSKKKTICNLCHSEYRDWEVSFEHWGLIDSVLQPLDLCIPCYKRSIPDHVDISNIKIREKQVLSDCLFIIMEYCESTLMEAIENGDHDDDVIWTYFFQTVQGLAHLHSHGIIHRDLKPSNIFVHEGIVHIGDFGLAMMTTASSSVPSSADRRHHQSNKAKSISYNVGTFLYQAPEITTVGNKKQNYDEKCDIYSLGVLLVEIFSNFGTAMERAKVLGDIKNYNSSNSNNNNKDNVLLPEEWAKSHEKQSSLAHRMLSLNPQTRPSCAEILGTLIDWEVVCEPSKVVSSVIRSQHCQIRKLQNEVIQRGDEIARLRQLLQQHGIQDKGVNIA